MVAWRDGALVCGGSGRQVPSRPIKSRAQPRGTHGRQEQCVPMRTEDSRFLNLSPLARQAALLVAIVFATVGLCVWLMQRTVASHPQFVTVNPERADHGHSLYVQTCASCHGINAQGLPHQGVDLRKSRFVQQQTDHALVKFLRVGRLGDDKATVLGLPMPAKGGNSSLSDDNLADIVAYLREVQQKHADRAAGTSAGTSAGAGAPTTRPALTMVSPTDAAGG